MKKYINLSHNSIIEKEILTLSLQAARYLSLIIIILNIIFISFRVDSYFGQENYLKLLWLRAFIFIFSIPVFILTFFPQHIKLAKLLAYLCLLMVGFSLDLMVRILGYDTPYYAGLNLIYLGGVFVPWGLKWTLALIIPVYLGYLLPIIFFDLDEIKLILLINNNLFQICTMIIVSAISHLQFNTRKNEILNRLKIEQQAISIQQQAEELKQSEQAKRQFIANVTHDLKTPLSIISGNIDKVEQHTNSIQAVKPYLAAINDSLTRGEHQLNALISLALHEDDKQKPNLSICNYTLFTQHFCMQFAPQAEQKKLHYSVEIPKKDSAIVNIDTIWTERILGNLILNAFKFTKEGDSLTIRIFSDKHYIWTEVTDTGCGIAEEKLPYIFKRKYQAHDHQKSQGFGLGLHIVKEMLIELGGDINVISKINEGTTFKFSLPLYKNTSTLPDEQPAESSNLISHFQKQINQEISGSTIYGDQSRFENNHPELPSILICEDTPGQLQLLIDCLFNEYNLFMAKNGKDGLQKLHNNADKISLIISDVKMPEMDGLEFCQHVFSEEQFKKIPFIFLTAYYNEHEQLIGIKNGATDYLQKPFNDAILREKVTHWISRRESERVMEDLVTTLEQRTVTLSKLQAILEHEIRNPLMLLAFINKAIQKLAEKHAASANSDKKYWEQAGNLKNVIDSISTILASSKSIEDQMKLNATKDEKTHSLFDMAIAQTKQYCQNINIIKEQKIDENSFVKCDLKMLTQVFINIIRNATEAIKEKNIPDGTITISTAIEKSLLKIEIADNGIGIPDEIKDNLFSYMYTTKKDGTGIGLYLSRKILRLHGGNIKIDSKEDKGTTFIIELPLKSNKDKPGT
jgi:signal transduction histidine kinase